MESKIIDDLLSQILRGEIVLFAGAGLSLYAGFPNGSQLAMKLRDTLTKEEIAEYDIPNSTELMDVAQAIENIKSRNELINLLIEIFTEKNINDRSVHDKISRIPYIKEIITTNYDYLFEESYTEIQKILFTKDLGLIDYSKPRLFKIHGDLLAPETVLITRDDYAKYNRERANSLYWNVINERLSTRSILFIGYSLLDINVRGEFLNIVEQLGNNMKSSYFISPKVNKNGQIFLKNNNLIYIDQTAEELLDILFEKICGNVINAFRKGNADRAASEEFLKNNDVFLNVDNSKTDKPIQQIGSLSGKGAGVFNFTFRDENNLFVHLSKTLTGETFQNLKIPGNNIENLTSSINGITIPFEEGFSFIEIISKPSLIGKVDIRFVDEFELNDLDFEIYVSKKLIEARLKMISSTIVIRIDRNKTAKKGIPLNIKFTHNSICRNVSSELDTFQLLKNITNGTPFTLFYNKKQFHYSPISQNFANNYATKYLTYFQNLSIIEKIYNVKFKDFNFLDIDDVLIQDIATLTKRIDGKEDQIVTKNTLVKIGYVDETFYRKGNLKSYFKRKNFQEFRNKPEIIDLHNIQINLGHPYLRVIEAEFKNMKEVLESKTQDIVFQCKELWFSYKNKNEIQLRS